MRNINIILNNSSPIGIQHGDSLSLSVPTSEPKHATPTHNRQFSHIPHHLIPPYHTQRTTIVLPGPLVEHEVHHHQQARRLLVREPVHPLCPAHHLRVVPGPLGDRVVDHDEGPEVSLALVRVLGLGDADRGGVRALHVVVEVEVQVGQAGLLG